ncbi:MAG TPA: hypothetical protein VM219_09040 [Phycisphaerae bacterium]|nr:hypothetical protein [Phycisphaerae bacterium]HUX02987.1 hypothetical protein [Phycisphaerae bacterium]
MTTHVKLRTITQLDVEREAALNPYWKGRWENYLAVACRIFREIPGVTRVLEIGPGSLSLVRGCDIMDIWNWGRRPLTFGHDAGAVPWPLPDDAYDVVVALQVLEHLGGDNARFYRRVMAALPDKEQCVRRQRAAFAEALRVAPRLLLSVPLDWKTTGMHAGITPDVVKSWAPRGAKVTASVKVGRDQNRRRLVELWQRETV